MAETIRRVRPTPTDAYLANPHKGCCTFQHFNGDELFAGTSWSEEGPLNFPAAKEKVIAGYLPSTVSYCRWFWRAMEPRKGQYDFSMIDGALQVCAQRGQTLAVRLMAFGSEGQPQVPDWYAAKFPTEERRRKSALQRTPVHDSREYLQHWGGFVKEFARRYDSHPLLESIDVTYIGPWGEGDGQCSAAQCKRFAQLWRNAFKRTPRLCMIGGEQMRAGIASGSGWRCDCFGDLRAVGSPEVQANLSWNHMYDAYPPEVIRGNASDAWKSAPVHFETCWVPLHWERQGFDLDFILEQGLKYHGTYFMPKYTRLPEKWIDRIATFCRKLGYRFVFRQAMLDCRVKAGHEFRFQSWIENTGVAPIYRRYDFAVRVRQGDKQSIVTFDDVDIRTWLPGDVWLDKRVKIGAQFKPGVAEVSAGLVDPSTQEARVSFATIELFSDRWLPLGPIEIT